MAIKPLLSFYTDFNTETELKSYFKSDFLHFYLKCDWFGFYPENNRDMSTSPEFFQRSIFPFDGSWPNSPWKFLQKLCHCSWAESDQTRCFHQWQSLDIFFWQEVAHRHKITYIQGP